MRLSSQGEGALKITTMAIGTAKSSQLFGNIDRTNHDTSPTSPFNGTSFMSYDCSPRGYWGDSSVSPSFATRTQQSFHGLAQRSHSKTVYYGVDT